MTRPSPNPLIESLQIAVAAAHAYVGDPDRAPADAFAGLVYSDLFDQHPAVRVMFPPGLEHQRDKFVRAFSRACANAWDSDTGRVALTDHERAILEALGVDHLKFGTLTAHYDVVVECLLFILRYFLADRWDTVGWMWEAASAAVATVMSTAAEKWLADGNAPWVDAVIRGIEYPGGPMVRVDLWGLTDPYPVPAGTRVSACLHAEPGDWTAVTVAHTVGARLSFGVLPNPRVPASLGFTEGAQAGDLVRLSPPNPPTPDPAVEAMP